MRGIESFTHGVMVAKKCLFLSLIGVAGYKLYVYSQTLEFQTVKAHRKFGLPSDGLIRKHAETDPDALRLYELEKQELKRV